MNYLAASGRGILMEIISIRRKQRGIKPQEIKENLNLLFKHAAGFT